MPVQSGTVFVSYYNRNYVTLEKLLSEKNITHSVCMETKQACGIEAKCMYP